MKEPSRRNSRLALAGGLAAALLVGGAGFLLGRASTERTPVAIATPPAAAPAPEPEPPTSRGVLGRSDLLALVARAADAVAAGRDPELGDVDGRRFVLRLPFGCDGPAGENSDAAMRWRYDPGANALRIHVASENWRAADWWSASSRPDIDSVEGFWIRRPWTLSEDCPAGSDEPAAAGTESVTLPGQTLALGQVLSADDARERRRDGQFYDAVVRVPEAELDTSQGFRLRISGRIARLPGSGPVRCQQPAGTEQRPICLVSVVIDEVAIENPANGEIVATWAVSRRDPPAADGLHQ